MFPKYPIHSFFQFVKANLPEDTKVIVDAPCGGGYVAVNLQKELGKDVLVIAGDINEEYMQEAAAAAKEAGVSPELHTGDIHELIKNVKPYDAFLIVNSLFLLPEPKQLMVSIGEKLKPGGKVMLIIPNIHAQNFKNFQAMNTGENKLILDKQQATIFFNEAGYMVERTEGLAYVTYIGKPRRWLWKFKSLYVYAFNILNRLAGGKPAYWGFVLSRN